MTTTTLGQVTTLYARGGSAEVVLAKDPRHNDRMVPLLKFSNDRGREYVVQLSGLDVLSVMRSLETLLSAEQDQISTWFAALSKGDRWQDAQCATDTALRTRS